MRRHRLGLRDLLCRQHSPLDVHHGDRNGLVRRQFLHLGQDHHRNGARAMKTRKLISLARLKLDEAGTAAVEFAIVSSVFITFIFGIAYSSIMLHSNAALQWAVESAARQAA